MEIVEKQFTDSQKKKPRFTNQKAPEVRCRVKQTVNNPQTRSTERRRREAQRREEEGRLEAAISFFFIEREIKFHQRAESQLISLNIKTAIPLIGKNKLRCATPEHHTSRFVQFQKTTASASAQTNCLRQKHLIYKKHTSDTEK